MGVTLAQSEYVIFLDDDDTFEPWHLQLIADYVSTTSPELLFCNFKVQYEDRTTLPVTLLHQDVVSIADVSADSTFVRNRIPNSCMVYRHDVVQHIQHDPALQIYEDWDFLMACLQGRNLLHLPINSVVIHKSQATAPENMRRGNTRDDLLVQAMLTMYQRHPAPSSDIRNARQALMASAGVSVQIESC
jgi:hypothetical protein